MSNHEEPRTASSFVEDARAIAPRSNLYHLQRDTFSCVDCGMLLHTVGFVLPYLLQVLWWKDTW